MIAVSQPDKTFKSTSLKIKFGYLKILNAKEKKVNVIVNGEVVSLELRLSETGEVYYPEEVKKIVRIGNTKNDEKNSIDFNRKYSDISSESNLSVADSLGATSLSGHGSPNFKEEIEKINNLNNIEKEVHLNNENISNKLNKTTEKEEEINVNKNFDSNIQLDKNNSFNIDINSNITFIHINSCII